MLSAEEDGPGNTAGVLALEEEGLGFAVLESEDLGVATDVELTLQQSQCQRFGSFTQRSSFPWPCEALSFAQSLQQLDRARDTATRLHLVRSFQLLQSPRTPCPSRPLSLVKNSSYLSRVDPLARECVVVGPHLECGCRLSVVVRG